MIEQPSFFIATHNRKKQAELVRILTPLKAGVVTAEELGISFTEVEETGETFYDNALLKAESGCRESHFPCIADDSGLEVDFLGGAPGVYSARFAGEHGNDEKNIEKLLNLLKEVPAEKRTARFVSVVCCVFPDGTVLSARGTCEGSIAFHKTGTGGFGYDPVFLYEGRSFAELTAAEKDALSHRGKALRSLADELRPFIENQRS